MMKRRELMKIGMVAPLALGAAAPLLQAQVQNPAAQYYRFKLGAFTITVASDGHMLVPASTLGNNVDPAEAKAFLERYHLSTEHNYSHLNHIVIETGTQTILVDAGDGGRFMPQTSGRLWNTLIAAGIEPSSITDVVLTHAHPDHIWGVRDEFDEPFLPDARYLIGGAEVDYWLADDLVNQVDDAEQQFVIGAVNSINTIADIMERVAGDYSVASGVTMIETPGHTAGHMSVLVDSDGEQMLITGDAFSHAWMNFVHPNWTQNADRDGEQTVLTRQRLLDMAVTDGILLAGHHFPFPGIGYATPRADAYEFVPAIWQWDRF